jgi:hypothetical protein
LGPRAKAAFPRVVSPWARAYIHNARRGHRLPRFERKLCSGSGDTSLRAATDDGELLVISQHLQRLVSATLLGFVHTLPWSDVCECVPARLIPPLSPSGLRPRGGTPVDRSCCPSRGRGVAGSRATMPPLAAALSQLQRGDAAGAVKSLRGITSTEPRNADAWRALGTAYPTPASLWPGHFRFSALSQNSA